MSPSESLSPSAAPPEDGIATLIGLEADAAIGTTHAQERVRIGNSIGRIERVPSRQREAVNGAARVTGQAVTTTIGSFRATASAKAKTNGQAAAVAKPGRIRARGIQNLTDEELVFLFMEAAA